MGLFDIFENKDNKIIKQYRDYKSKPFGIGLKIDNLTDQDILWVHNNVKKNFDFSSFPNDFKVSKVPEEVLFVITAECLEFYNANNKSEDVHMQILGQFLESYLNGGLQGLFSVFRPAAKWRLNIG